MESATSSLPFVSRDGSSTGVEDEGALPVTARLAKDAALLFQAGKFVDCLGILNQLVQKKDYPKVRHNILIAENFEYCRTDPKKLIEEIEKIKNQIEVLAHTPGEHSEPISNDGEKSMVGMKGTNTALHDEFSDSSLVFGNEFDTSVAIYNIAVVWFHLHGYEKSFSYLDTLYQNIEPLDEGTALRICLLLVDVALLSHHVSRSADVINYMEKVFRVNSLTDHVDNGTSTEQQSLPVSKPASLPSSLVPPDSSPADSVATANITLENSLTRTSSDEALEDESLQLLSSLEQNLQRPGIAASNDLSRNQAAESLSIPDLRLKLHLFKVRLLLITRNLKAAKREVKIAMNLARGKDYSMALYLKTQLEYARRNYRKALRLLMTSTNCMETSNSSVYYNNLGCIYYQLGKYHTSGVFFSEALKISSVARKEKPPKLLTLSQDKSLLISYNCGIHSLACCKPFHAAKCFQKASLVFYNRPLLWLRLAECCLMALEKGLITSNFVGVDRCDIRATVVGKGKWRQLALKHGTPPNGHYGCAEKNHDDKQPDLSMSLARKCLVNVLYLLDSSEAKCKRSSSLSATEENESQEKLLSADHKPALSDTKESNLPPKALQPNSNGKVKEPKSGNNQNTPLQNSITEHEYNCTRENLMIRQATLADLAYVELALGNPLQALSVARSLLELPDCSKIYLFFGTMYIAEALCLLNQPMEAAEELMMYVSGGNSAKLPYSREDCEKWKAQKLADNEDSNVGTVDESQACALSSPEVARGLFCANFAANMALLGNLEQAHHFVTRALSDVPNSPQAIITGIYLDLKRGKTQEAVAKLKQHSGVRFLHSNVSLNGSSRSRTSL